MKQIFKILLAAVLFLVIQSGFAQTALFQKKIYVNGPDTLPYRILYPDNFDPGQQYPLILILHGMGERGNDNELQLKHGGNFFSSPETRRDFPAIVVFPQCSIRSFWASMEVINENTREESFVFNPSGEPTTSMKLVLGFIDQLIENKYVNKSKMYVGGISMGGMGTYELLYRRPDVFAAAFPICGGGNPVSAVTFAGKVKVWAFHGAKDDVVLPQYTKQMVDAINKAGGDARLTLYPEGNHGVWDNVFAEPELLKWLLLVNK
ncbi:MAG: prolyl oligopeptidase family serine peptidase [Bacteroidales bacterium]|nr:prolyl oligopeptidase family serine peptidase [Bacteroidales bacterium]